MVWPTQEISSVRLPGMRIAMWLQVTPLSTSTKESCLPANRWLLSSASISVSAQWHVAVRLGNNAYSHICPISLFSMFASVNTSGLEKWQTGNCTSEACDPLDAPANWNAMPDDLISKCWLLPIQRVSASTHLWVLITHNQLRQPGVTDRTRWASEWRKGNTF